MKKLVFLLIVGLTSVVNNAFATDYFKLNGKTVTGNVTLNSSSDGYGITSGTVVFNASTKVLTLNNAVINTTKSGTSTINVIENIDIKVVGTCRLTNASYRVINNENRSYRWSIYGDGIGSSKPYLNSQTTDRSAIRVGASAYLTLKNLSLYAEGSNGINGDGSGLYIVDSYVEATSKGNESPIRNFRTYNASSETPGYTVAVVSPVGASYSTDKMGVVDANGNLLGKGTTVKINRGVAVTDTNFPNANFRSYIKSQSYGSDGLLTDEEIAEITEMYIESRNISNLKGIEYFTALTKLYCERNRLTTLDVSNNTALTWLDCYDNQLTALDVSKNTALTDLVCSVNQLTSLDVSKNTALERLYCYDNQLTTIDVSNCTAQERLDCYRNRLTTLDVSNCTALTLLNCYDNQIKYSRMQELVNSLPNVTNGSFCVYDAASDTEGNEITNDQVQVAEGKGWAVYARNGSYWNSNYNFGGIEDLEGVIAINEDNFPDENFRNHLLRQSYGTDGYLTEGEIAGITYMDIESENISNLKGIEYFTALKWLYCEQNQLTALDVSNNTALTYLTCYRNQLTTLDVSNCTALTYLLCYDNQLTAIDVSKNTALTEFSCSGNQLTAIDVSNNTALTEFSCSGNQLTAIDVSNNTALTYLSCSNNQLTALDVSNCTALTLLYCYNNQIKYGRMLELVNSLPNCTSGKFYVYDAASDTEGNEITNDQVQVAEGKGWTVYARDGNQWTSDYDFGSLEDLEGVIAINEDNFPDENFRNYLLSQSYGTDGYLTEWEIAEITEIRVSSKYISNLKGIEYFTALTDLDCWSNQLTALDVSKNTTLTDLDCGSNQLTALDVSKNTALTDLSCSYNQLTAIDVSKNTALVNLSCDENQLTSLDVSKNTALTYLGCSDNQLTAIDVSNCTALEWLYCNDNQLTAIDVSNCTALTELYCYDNQLTSLDVSKNTALKTLKCDNNPLTSLDVSKNTRLTSFSCENNQLTSLDVSKNTALIWLYCQNNQLTSLDVSKNTALESLCCNYNQLTSLDVSKNTALKNLECYGNQLTSLNVSNTALTELHCSGNQLTFLDVSKNTALTQLYCDDNQLTSLDVSKNTALDDLWCNDNRLTSLDVSSKNTALTKLYCYSNQIKYSEMQLLVNSLPTTGGYVYVYDVVPEEGNEISKAQAQIARDKGWRVYVRYHGEDIITGSPYEVYETVYNFPDVILISTADQLAKIGIDAAYPRSGNYVLTSDINCGETSWTPLCSSGYSGTFDGNGHTVTYKIITSRNYCGLFDGITGTVKNLKVAGTITSTGEYIGGISGQNFGTITNCHSSVNVSGSSGLGGIVGYNARDIYYCSSSGSIVGSDWGVGGIVGYNDDASLSHCTFTGSVQNTNATAIYTGMICGRANLSSLQNCYYLADDMLGVGLSSGGSQDYGTTSMTVSQLQTYANLFTDAGADYQVYAQGILEGLSSGIKINETNFPDENFRSYLLAQYYGTDGRLTPDEIASVTSIDVRGKQIKNLKGIKYFTALTQLYCNDNQLTSLDVSQNTRLEKLYCYENQLTSLDVSKNTALKYLDCYNNQLTSLDVSQNTALKNLWCNNNQLTSLDVSQNTVLTELCCYDNRLTSLDVSQNTALTELLCYNNQLTSLDVSQNTRLGKLYCYENQLTSLDVSKNTALKYLDCYNNQLTSLNVSKNTALEELWCYDNQLTALDVSQNTALKYLYCYNNQLTSLDVSQNTALTVLQCYNNQLTSLDVSQNTALTFLSCENNQIKYSEMQQLVNSLPTVTNGDFYVYDADSDTEGNEITNEQVQEARAKGWTAYARVDYDWVTIFDFDTAIEDVAPSDFSDGQRRPIYNTAGQRTDRMQRGINIVNGKKVLKK